MRWCCHAPALLVAGLTLNATGTFAQAVPVNTFPRQTDRLAEVRANIAAARAAAEARDTVGGLPELEAVAVTAQSARARARFAGVQWSGFGEAAAARFWEARSVELLPSATLAPGADRTALFTELAGVLSGAWRVGLGTALAVGLAGDSGVEGEQPGGNGHDEDAAFRRFIAGGGNLSLAGYRPLLVGNAASSSHLLLALPRAWVDVPTLSSTDRVESFGAELAAEYQYHRYRTQWQADTLSRGEVPFLTLHARVSVATGPRAFHLGLGRPGTRPLLYALPTMSLNLAEGVRVGASYFYGFGSLRHQEAIRLHLTLAPVRGEPEDVGSP